MKGFFKDKSDYLMVLQRFNNSHDDTITVVVPYIEVPDYVIGFIKSIVNKNKKVVIITDKIKENLNELEGVNLYITNISVHVKAIYSKSQCMIISGFPSGNRYEMGYYFDKKEFHDDVLYELKNQIDSILEDISSTKCVKTEWDTINFNQQQLKEQEKKINELAKCILQMSQEISTLQEKVDIVESLMLELFEQHEDTLKSINTEIIQIKDKSYDNKEELVRSIYNSVMAEVENLCVQINLKDSIVIEVLEKELKKYLTIELWNKLTKDMKQLLITSEVVHNFMKNKKNLDFSPVVIPITKVLEKIINERIYMPLYESQKLHSSINRIKNEKMNKYITLGEAIYLLRNKEILSNLNMLKIFNVNIEESNYFIHDDSYLKTKECKTLIGQLEYIRVNYRNAVAHTEGINKILAEECRDYMIVSKGMIKEILGYLT